MRLTIAVVALLLASNALADNNEKTFCWGRPIADLTRELAADEDVIGVEPSKVEASTCGGGLTAVGEKIPTWSCLMQVWDIKIEGTRRSLILLYSKDSGKWELSNGRLCDTSGETCVPLQGISSCVVKSSTTGRL